VFTGIVEVSVPTRSFESSGGGARLVLPAPADPSWAVDLGESVAVSGVCLTVAALVSPQAGSGEPVPAGTPGADMVFDLSAETLERTWFGDLVPGRRVNLERALRLGDRLSGHMVSGHVDGGGRVTSIEDLGDGGREIGFEVDAGLERYLIEKGSVTLDGISLTVVEPAGREFRVAVIPVTLDVTNLGACEVGQTVNVEADLVGKWIERLLP